MHIKKYVAEFVGTLALASAVVFLGGSQLTPIIAGLVVLFFVYSIGSISGAHINPAITIGLFSIKKISLKEAGMYILAQALAGAAVLIISSRLLNLDLTVAANATLTGKAFWAEFFGTLVFAFGIASVVYGSVEKTLSGVMIGVSLFLGIIVALLIGSNADLNPAVALAGQSLNLIYLIAPILGSIAGMQLYAWLKSEKIA